MNIFKPIMPIAVFNLTFLVSAAFANDDLLVFGGPSHDQFLGCFICNEFNQESICNGFGKYGNEFSSDGMFNEFTKFGNEFNSSSPWNEFSTSESVPVVVDHEGKFYGYFTINDSRTDAVDFSSDLKVMFDQTDGDIEKVRVLLCESLGYSG